VSLLTLSLSGCAGIFIAGAATTANLVTDTRTTKEIWNDNNIEFEVAAITNKQPFRGNVRVTASSYRGSVVLMGQAMTDSERRAFENQAK
ncbi:BON domain-containing protein, partial [Vibrio sp. 10N.222.49.E5]